MIAALPPNGIILAVLRWRECRPVAGMPRLRLPLQLSQTTQMQFPGPRGDELPLYRVQGRLPDGSCADLWAFFEPGQRAAAQRRLSQLPLGDDPGLQGLGHQP